MAIRSGDPAALDLPALAEAVERSSACENTEPSTALLCSHFSELTVTFPLSSLCCTKAKGSSRSRIKPFSQRRAELLSVLVFSVLWQRGRTRGPLPAYTALVGWAGEAWAAGIALVTPPILSLYPV